MHVVATAGHVDHGKSTLVRALTGMEPDRWAEERRRGMTIDLGYAWTTVGAEQVAFVDVPGHERFIANMLAGLGPAPAVMFVVAADQGWQAQSDEHLAAVRALGVRHALLVVTRSDLADPGPALAAAQAHLVAAGLPDVPAVTVSGRTGAGLDDLRGALAALLSTLPRPPVDGRVRLWVDRSFTVKGAGTVVTGTLDAGTIAVGDELETGGRAVRVRGIQSAGAATDAVTGVARVALNLRGVRREEIGRGDALLTPDAWRPTTVLDVRVDTASERWTGELMLHVGTAAVAVHVRPLGHDLLRLTLRRSLALVHGDRAVVRAPGTRAITGVLVLDADPPPLLRRGAASRRAGELGTSGLPDAATELGRRGAVQVSRFVQLGFDPAAARGARRVGGWLVSDARWAEWTQALTDVVAEHGRADALAAGMPVTAAAQRLGAPDEVVASLATDAGLLVRDGLLTRPGATPTLGAAEAAVRELESRLGVAPFRAPERQDLEDLGLRRRELAVAVRSGRLLLLPGDIVLLPNAPAVAARTLATLPQPFTTSDARQALDTTRRVAIPLLEHLDDLRITERQDDGRRVCT